MSDEGLREALAQIAKTAGTVQGPFGAPYQAVATGALLDLLDEYPAESVPQPVEELAGVLTDPDWGKAPRPVLDREAVRELVQAWKVGPRHPEATATERDNYRRKFADAVMALARSEAEVKAEAAEQIAQMLEDVPGKVYPEDIFPPDGASVDAQSAKVMRFAYPAAAGMVRDMGAEWASEEAGQ